jgi:hypothetical protein
VNRPDGDDDRQSFHLVFSGADAGRLSEFHGVSRTAHAARSGGD